MANGNYRILESRVKIRLTAHGKSATFLRLIDDFVVSADSMFYQCCKEMIFNFCPRAIFKALSLSTIVLLIANLMGIAIQLFPGHGVFYGLIRLFDFNSESNIPTLYSSINLMFSALLLACIAAKHKAMESSWVPWLGLAFILSFLSVDETALFHEQLAAPFQQLLNISVLFYYVWVVPYIAILSLLLLCYFKFLMQLSKRTRLLFISSAAVFVIGAVGFEVIGNLQVQAYGSDETLYYRLIYSCEEFLEMQGVVILIYALFDYIASEFGSLKVFVQKPLTHLGRTYARTHPASSGPR